MTDNQNNSNESMVVPIIAGLLLIVVAAWLVWATQIRPPLDQARADRATAEAEARGVEAATDVDEAAEAAPVIDMEAAIAAANKGGCAACHTIPGIPNANGQVGPNLSNIGADAGGRIDGYTAEEYIHESLVEPLAFTAPECPFGACTPGGMPILQLEAAEVDVLVSYMLTLGGSPAAVAEVDTDSDVAAAHSAPTLTAVALNPINEPAAPAEFLTVFNRGGCAGCHTIPGIPGANGQVGPDLSEIGLNAGSRVSGVTTEAYIRESVLDPNAVIAPECPAGDCPANVMLQSFAASLSDDDVETVVAYLSVLGTSQAIALSEQAGAVALDASLPPESVLDPFMPLPKDPASDVQIALGKLLFFDARLSNNNSLSCASCHQPDKAFTDGEAMSQGYPSTNYFRNVPTLYNTVYTDYFYWDGRLDGNDMATLVRDHLTEAHFMSNDGRLMAERLKQVPAYVDLFNEAYGSGPGFGSTLRAIAAYVQSLNSTATPYDEYLAGDSNALSDEAQAGLALFEGKAGCSSCHSGALLSNGDFYNTGVATDPAMLDDPERHITFRRFLRVLGTPNYRNIRDDVGLYALSFEDEDWAKFRTPGLREVGRTAPYMHNGSLATLEDVVRFYNDGGGADQSADLKSLRLTDDEITQLVAFLESLDSDPAAVEVPVLPGYQLLTLGGSE